MQNQNIYSSIITAMQKKASEILPSGSQVALYGSRARGDAKPESDWDLQILIEGEDSFYKNVEHDKVIIFQN